MNINDTTNLKITMPNDNEALAPALTEIPGAPYAQKRRKKDDDEQKRLAAAEETGNSKRPEQNLREITISRKGKVRVKFVELVAVPIPDPNDPNGEGDEEEKQDVKAIEYTVTSQHEPHDDLLKALKKLRKHALEICEIEVDGKHLNQYTVVGVKIQGDIVLRQSRVIMVIGKEVKRTGKQVLIVTPQTTMYGESEYEKAEEMSKLIEDVVSEVWLYIGGKYADDGQLPLFER